MTPRLNFHTASPEAAKAMLALEEASRRLSIPLALRELVKMRVSQINGCAYCLDIHAPDARKAGITQQQLDVLAAWRESPAFSRRERAALAWAEALTRLEAAPVLLQQRPGFDIASPTRLSAAKCMTACGLYSANTSSSRARSSRSPSANGPNFTASCQPVDRLSKVTGV